MTGTSPTTPAPTRPIPGRIAAVLKVVAALIAHARHFAATATTRVAAPEFATAAAVFGTDNLPTILHRMQRGMLRALALQQYLLARAARGCNLRFAWPPCVELQPHHRPPAKPAPPPRPAPLHPCQPDPALLGPDDPAASRLPTPEEFAAEVRRRPVGRTIAYICMDLGIAPGLCDGDFWNQVEKTLRRYGGSLRRLYQVRARREDSLPARTRQTPGHLAHRLAGHAPINRAPGARLPDRRNAAGRSRSASHCPKLMPPGTNPVIAVAPVAGTSLAGGRPHGKFQPRGHGRVDRTMTSLAFTHFPSGTE